MRAHATASSATQHIPSHVCLACNTCSTRNFCQAALLDHELSGKNNNHLFHSNIVKSGEHIFHAGDDLSTLYVVKSGSFKTYQDSEAGDKHVMSFYMPGEIMGVESIATGIHESSAIAMSTSAICSVPIKVLRREINTSSSDWLLKQAASGNTRENHSFKMSIRNSTNAFTRLAFFINTFSQKYKFRGYSGLEFRLDMQRQDIADYLGLTIETVSRTLTKMQENKILVINGRNITIVNVERLRALMQGLPTSKIPLQSLLPLNHRDQNINIFHLN